MTTNEVLQAEIEAAYQAQNAPLRGGDRKNRRPQMWCVVLCGDERTYSAIVGPYFHKGSAVHEVIQTVESSGMRFRKSLTPLLQVQAFPADDEMKGK